MLLIFRTLAEDVYVYDDDLPPVCGRAYSLSVYSLMYGRVSVVLRRRDRHGLMESVRMLLRAH